MKRDVFTKTIKSLEAGFGKKMTKGEIEVYWEMLKGYEDRDIKNATVKCIKELTFFPRIVNIIKAIEGDIEVEAELAWIYLKEKIEDDGCYHSVSFPKYPVIGAVVEALGGWLKITDIKANEEVWIKKEFITLYPILKKSGRYPLTLPGIFEIENNRKGYNENTMIEGYGRHLDGSKVDREALKGLKKDTKLIGVGLNVNESIS